MGTHTPEYPNLVHKYPIEYFKGGTPEAADNMLSKFILYGGGAFFGYSTVFVGNRITERPLHAGIHKYVIAISLSVAVGHIIYKWRQSSYAERDAAFRHYMELHPEDFPAIERRQYKDIFQPWIPYR